ncbi:MAG TPA: hypothetical protein VNF06_00835 [Candidatus Aquilonibacter sp.]|nr:hypothetical protein [Candidatus Aquilonibacter sp.]
MTFADDLAQAERDEYIKLWPIKADPKTKSDTDTSDLPSPAFSSPQEERRQGSKLSLGQLRERHIALMANSNSKMVNGRLSGSSYDLVSDSTPDDDVQHKLNTQPEDLEFYGYRTPQGASRYKIWSKREQKFISSSDF